MVWSGWTKTVCPIQFRSTCSRGGIYDWVMKKERNLIYDRDQTMTTSSGVIHPPHLAPPRVDNRCIIIWAWKKGWIWQLIFGACTQCHFKLFRLHYMTLYAPNISCRINLFPSPDNHCGLNTIISQILLTYPISSFSIQGWKGLCTRVRQKISIGSDASWTPKNNCIPVMKNIITPPY